MGCIQSSEGKSQNQTENVSGKNNYHMKTDVSLKIMDGNLIPVSLIAYKSLSDDQPQETKLLYGVDGSSGDLDEDIRLHYITMGCIQSIEEKGQHQRENVYHIKTEGQITTFGDTQRSAYTRHSKEHSSEGNGCHTGTCGYDNSPDSHDEKGHSLNLRIYLPRALSPDLSMQRYDDEAPNNNNRPCDSDKGILYDTSSDSDDNFIINKVTSDKHSISPHPKLLTATAPDMSLQMFSRRYKGDSEERFRYQAVTVDNVKLRKRKTQRKSSHINYSTGDSDEDIRYKKITTEDHLPNPSPNRPRAPPAPPPADHLN